MARRDIIAGLDIGTSAVRCAICEVDQRGNWNIIGLGSSRSEGIKKGAVVDIESTVGCILQAVETEMCIRDSHCTWLGRMGYGLQAASLTQDSTEPSARY